MSGRRVLGLYGTLLLAFAVVVCRLYWLCANTAYAARAEAQSTVSLALPARRGGFYDCEGRPLTDLTTTWYTLCFPGGENYASLYRLAGAAGQVQLYQKRSTAAPFLLALPQDASALGFATYAVPQRYAAAPLAAHLLGTLDAEGHGVSGLEDAFDDILTGSGAHDTVFCAVTARGRLRTGETPQLVRADSGAVGVQLTLSRPVQRAVEAVASQLMKTGCIIVLDTASAAVRACVSVPGFDPANVADSLDAADSPLVDRTLNAYAVGSVFKPVLAAAALEADCAMDYTCPGAIVVGDRIFRCAGGSAHGEVDLSLALQKSCNGYFVRLGQTLGVESVYAMAASLGLGQSVNVADGLTAAAGALPAPEQLASAGDYANFCFGQGELLATPVQVAAMMNAIAADGVYRTPFFVQCTLNETTGEVLETLAHSAQKRVFSKQTASALRTLLAGVVAEGTGREAAASYGTSAGKTGTAQTGQFSSGVELKNYWFAGFWPAESPRYTIVVLQDVQTEPTSSSAAVFAAVCDALAILI